MHPRDPLRPTVATTNLPDHLDYVTGLMPRGRFERSLDELFKNGERFASVIVDVVGLKRMNEEGGFVAGDAVLRAASDRLRRATEGPTGACGVYRIGGDEMVALYAGPAAEVRAAEAVKQLSVDGATPRLRAGMTAATPSDTRETFLNRLYATARGS